MGSPPEKEVRPTYCRICEPQCGLLATVEGGKVTALRPNPEHRLSQGYACPKGIAMTDVQNDPDRVLHPLRRGPRGFERVSWDEALADIGERLSGVRARDGPESIGWYMGTPGLDSYSHTIWAKGFVDALGTPHYYTSGSQDVNNQFAAGALLYGSPLVMAFPDVRRTRFLLMLGANPMVSNGSTLSMPRAREHLRAIVRRGGRIVVVDPRRSETAREFEHLPIRPDGDAWMLLSMLHVLFREGRTDRTYLGRHCSGAAGLEELAADFAPEATAARTGVAPERVRALARDFAASPAAAAYGRIGTSLGRFGTLTEFLLNALNAVTGNLDRPGGSVFGSSPVDVETVPELLGVATYGKRRSRVGGFPDVLGQMPAAVMAREIATPGRGQLKALFVSAGNPVLSVPNGPELERALGELDLLVSLDLYVNETNRHADYVLPATTWLEREDLPVAYLNFFFRPFIGYTEAVVEPAGEARPEWAVVEALSRSLGMTPSSAGPVRALGRLGLRLTPRQLLAVAVRTSSGGDLFGLRRRGLNIAKLRRSPHGLLLAPHIRTGVLPAKLRHRDRRVHLAPPAIAAEVGRLAAEADKSQDPAYPLRLIGMRELRSHNSWMHNSPSLMRRRAPHALRVNPDDALAAGVSDGEPARLSSKTGALEVPVRVTDEMTPGTVALPHGWGHRGGWSLANRHPGANINELTSSAPGDIERLAGMAALNGVPVRLERVDDGTDRAFRPDRVRGPLSGDTGGG
jgi:formate dehydrogenase